MAELSIYDRHVGNHLTLVDANDSTWVRFVPYCSCGWMGCHHAVHDDALAAIVDHHLAAFEAAEVTS